ncbi:lipase family protein [Alteromonas gilva]|uniref:Lipase n=1 Tax=Alteromonas gilva TaxID=2987522 RepID=A0ABT5L2A8_9ALTE|nr:lipase [Alteromonas gilva]MDC8830559.1 lipase [Alteromonas gilva]
MKKLKQYQYERYAILCQMAYPGSYFSYPETLEAFNEKLLMDKFERIGVRVLWREHKKEVIVVFRGSISWGDWLGNFCFLPVKENKQRGRIHWGFKRLLSQPMYSSHKSLAQALPLQELLLLILAPLEQAGKRFTFIGHSSGGVMACLFANTFESMYPNKVKRVVTFGQPAFASLGYKRRYQLHNKTYRICCDLDIVTFMPLVPYLFIHVGKMLWLHDDQIYENTPTYARFLRSMKSWLLRPFTYHYMKKYIRNKTLFDKH